MYVGWEGGVRSPNTVYLSKNREGGVRSPNPCFVWGWFQGGFKSSFQKKIQVGKKTKRRNKILLYQLYDAHFGDLGETSNLLSNKKEKQDFPISMESFSTCLRYWRKTQFEKNKN